jgi:NADPH:quinone reductase-like Zn-dependent oxidoreductase
MGVVTSTSGQFGMEAAGVVTKVGPQVDNLSLGDRVMYMGDGSFSTSLTISAKLCVQIPPELSFEDAATMPCVFATVIYSLIEVARLEKGQSVLIHSACGGVGIAAIQICKMLGAEIYATVGNDDKVHHLMSTYGIPRNRIFHSRDASFLPEIRRETNDRGVDFVLNSLSGELLHASWECVAEFGSMLEIGKRDFYGHGQLAMHNFAKNRLYCGVDLGHLIQVKPEMSKRYVVAFWLSETLRY